MKIPPPNYTQTPNDFFDQIAKTLKEGELRVLLMIMRQTFGWRKSWDRISLGQLEEKTGMCRDAVNNALKSLVAKGLVLKRKEGKIGQEKCWYSLETEHVEEDKEIPDTENDLHPNSNSFYQSSKTTPDQSSLTTTPSRFRRPTKETITKEKKKKERGETPPPPSSEHTFTYSDLDENDGQTILTKITMPLKKYNKLLEMYGENLVIQMLKRLHLYSLTHPKKFMQYGCYYTVVQTWIAKEKKEKKDVEKVSKHHGFQKDETPVDSKRVYDFR